MKYLLVYLLIFVTHYNLIGQEFKTSLFFQNSIGELDTVSIGYDLLSTIQVDTQFGEFDISTTPFQPSLDVRLAQTDVNEFDYGSAYWNYIDFPSLISYQSKIDILPRNCEGYESDSTIDGWPPHSTILIPAKNFPIKISWDSTNFQTNCLENSFLTLWPVNTWWDTQSFESSNPFGRWHEMSKNTSLTINESLGHQYITEANDTLMMLFIVLFNDTDLISNTNEVVTLKLQYSVYPNPCSERLLFNTMALNHSHYKIWSSKGVLVQEGEVNGDEIDISNLKNETYFISFQGQNEKRKTIKFIKR